MSSADYQGYVDEYEEMARSRGNRIGLVVLFTVCSIAIYLGSVFGAYYIGLNNGRTDAVMEYREKPSGIDIKVRTGPNPYYKPQEEH